MTALSSVKDERKGHYLLKEKHLQRSKMPNKALNSLLCLVVMLLNCPGHLCINHPPRFELEDPQQTEIVLRLKEGSETPVGSLIYRIRGSDQDGDILQFALQGKVANELLRIEATSSTEANIYLKKELDREVEEEYSFVLSLTDGHLGDGNFIPQSLLILVEDINDNEPIFKPFVNTVFLQENSLPDVIITVEATDRDGGAYGQVIYSLDETDTDGYFSISTVGQQGVVRCLKPLDYEYKSLYHLKILAKDRGNEGRVNTATAGLLVRVLDQEDQLPEFVSIPSITRIPEDIAPGSSVVKVKAIDGDRGINNPIIYSLQNDNQYFRIDSSDGTVFVKGKLDRESGKISNGAYVLSVLATEVTSNTTVKPSVTAEVTILVQDVNDESPSFKSSYYKGEIDENSPLNMPVVFTEQSIPEVFDYDQGTNGTFYLSLKCTEDAFDIYPTMAVNEASFSIRVKDPTLLNYERLKVTNCTIMAKEIVTWQPKSSVVPVVINIRDVNDNIPQFIRETYQTSIPENSPAGTTVAWIQATDEDSGNLGTAGIRYTSLQGSLAEKLLIDPATGIITVREGGPNVFDREKISEHIVIVEAKDMLGTGNRNTVQLKIILEDVNDNAPVCSQSQFEIYVEENEVSFPYRFVIQATDHDLNGSKNSEIQYSIVDGNSQGNFSIDANSGEIKLVHPLDFELISATSVTTSSYYASLGNVRVMNLTIGITDLGNPPLSTNVSVLVHVHDANDFSPVFSRASYSKTISEDTSGGTSILQVKAFDLDGSSPNNLVAYRINNGALDKFVIDSENGIISIANGASLDPDRSEPRATEYHLEILAMDGGLGSEQRHSTIKVIITVKDVNNKSPILRNPGKIHVKENIPVGVIISELFATDPDDNPALRYWIDFEESESRSETGIVVRDSEYNITSWFDVNTLDGRVRVMRELDREKAEVVNLAIRVEDAAAATTGQTASGMLTIVIDDVNDNDPFFHKPFYRRSVPENSKRGTVILTLSAEDLDKNRSIHYSIDGPLELIELVHLDVDTGEIVVAGKIDRERYAWINLTARASDSGLPVRSTFVPVYIQVLDENDNNPQFVNIQTNLSVKEDTSVGTVITRVEAFDPDAGDFGRITYLMDRRSSNGKFAIDPESGAVIVAGVLNREEQQRYTLIIEAWDNYKFGYSAGESRSAFQQLLVVISDVNDEVPVFEPVIGCSTITEFHDPRAAVTTVHATDKDDPNTLNGKVMFTIESGNDQELFGIANTDFSSARIYALKPLVGHHGNYSLRIKAQDRGFPPNFAFQDIDICVSDFNDHPPVFIYPDQNATLKITENITVGSIVSIVTAVDEDVGLNSEVHYFLKHDPLGHWKWFKIDNVTGALMLAQPLDREKQKIYEIRIEARDLGLPTSLSTDLDLVIYIKNVNDYEPHFQQDVFEVNFTEHKSPKLQVVKLPETVDLDDPDDPGAPRDPTCLFIVGGNEMETFGIDTKTQSLIVMKELDRELQSTHTLLIKATENCSSVPSTISFFDTNDDTLLKVVVNVEDINDSPPVFTKDVFTGGFTTESDFGTEVLRVRALDMDDGKNSELRYYIIPPIRATLIEGMDQAGSNPFVVDETTGAILLNFDPQRRMKGYFDLEVYVNDSGGLTDKARVFIYLLREDQRVRFIMRQHPQQLRPKIEYFRDLLGNITNAIVNVDEIKIHSNDDGIVDKTRTDVYMHFVNPEDNSILEVETVLRLIDANIEELDQLFKDFNVLDTSPAEPLRGIPFERNFSLFWAGGTAVFLGLLLVLVLGLCLSQRMTLMRKLKAASATAFGSHESSLHGTTRVPNTNQHSVEGSNPIWRHDLEAEWFKSEDFYRCNENDVLDSLDDNAVLGTNRSTPPDSSATNTVSVHSTTETFNKNLLQQNILSARQLIFQQHLNVGEEHVNEISVSEKECEVAEVKEDNVNVSGMRIPYQKNVYHFGYPNFQDKCGDPFIAPRKLETTEL